MSHSALHRGDLRTFKYIVTHVFFPLQIPDRDDYSIHNDHALAEAVASAAHLHHDHLDQAEVPQWNSITGMLDNLLATAHLESLGRFQTVSQLSSMNVGDVRAFLIRARNAGIVFRKQQNVTIFESFEVSPEAKDVMASEGKLICSYPGPAIEIPTAVFGDNAFLSELVNFLVHMHDDIFLVPPPARQAARPTVLEARDARPHYITELLTGILRSVGSPASISRISKRVGDDVVWNYSKLPWRRSSLWLLIRVSLQTSLLRSTHRHHTYKEFMLFFMCCLAKENICTDLPNDLLHAMSAKISRRLRKLGSSAPDWLSRTALQTCTSLRSTLMKRWEQVQDSQCVSPLWAPAQLDPAQDIHLSLLNSCNYLHHSLTNQSIDAPDSHFNPKHLLRGALDDFLSPDGIFFEEACRAEPHVTLYDVERAVELGIDAWVAHITDNNEACEKLEILANKYSSSARETYRNNPELLSVMLLTMVELWIALDKIAIKETPMLADYSPEVPIRLLEGLLFCRERGLHRLRHAYLYLSHRYSSAKGGWSVFSSTITSDNFAVRFYKGSSHLQRLKARIEQVAQDEVRQKVTELEEANVSHAELRRKAAEADHEFAVDGRGNGYHSRECKKCTYKGQSDRMYIRVHEWPLPEEQLHAEAVVFELDCPVSFNMWRTATFHLLVDLCTPLVKPEDPGPCTQLPYYTALKPYLKQHPRSRITLASDTRPFVDTHHNPTSVPTSPKYVCVSNALGFYAFDSRAHILVSKALGHENITEFCTYQLQSGPYHNLQKYIVATSHTSNEIMADQADCHKDISIHEFIAFGHLRSGSFLQWLNILRELRGRSLSFHRREVHFLLAQAVSQVGLLAGTEWTWHQEIQQPSFCYALLEELEKLLRDVEANWLEAVTMDTISFLLRRLLVSSPDRDVSQRALGLLRAARSKAFSWVQELSDKLTEAPGDEELRGFLRDIAAICRSLFDVDPVMISELLHTAEDIKVLLSSAILIHHHTPANVSSLPIYSQLLLDRNLRLSLALENVISDVIQADSRNRDIDLAVSWFLPDYRPGSKWTPLQNPNSRWFSCTTAELASRSSQVVHFNLLDGSLLVDGKPIGILPSEIQRHPLYARAFGKQVLEVIPGDLSGMDYSTKGRISNYKVYFSLRDRSLVVRAIPMDGSEIIELIPPEMLKEDLPAVLIEGHAHWLNLSTSVMEIRPLNTLWKDSPDNWRVDCTPGRYRMHRGHEFLVDTRSKTWDMVSSLLKPLDTPQNLIISVTSTGSNQPSSMQLSVVLLRYGLSFYVNEDGDLQSHNLRGMVYDENQSIGTLFGLVNQLVLRPRSGYVRSTNEVFQRCVLIPEGKVSFKTHDHHVRVEVNTHDSPLHRVTYQTYRIDTDLSYLAGNAGLTSKLFCAYLHALTSGCSTDPFTGRSGTEEALSILRSAGCWSIMRFGSRDAELLRLIASICPKRDWHSEHLSVQLVSEQPDLPVNSQHHSLYLVCKAIKQHYERIQLFYEGQSDTLFQNFPRRGNHLLGRSIQRAAYLFPSGFSEQHSRANLDVRYPAGDLSKSTEKEHRACAAATIVYRRTPNSGTNKDIVLNQLKLWTMNVSGNATSSLQYERSWLNPDLPLIWLETYNLLRKGDEGKWFQMLFSLPAMAYASPTLSDLVPTFVAFAINSQFRSEDPPHYDTFDLSRGYRPHQSTLRSYVSDCAHPFERSPESAEPAEIEESSDDLRKRQCQMYNDRRNPEIDAAVEQLLNAWPCETPPRCSLNPDLFNAVELTSNVQILFANCYRNHKLAEHLARVQKILNGVYCQGSPPSIVRYSFDPSQYVHSFNPWSLTVEQLFTRPAPLLSVHSVKDTLLSGHLPLHKLIDTVEVNAGNAFQQRYISALRASADRFGSEVPLGAQGAMKLPTARALQEYYTRYSSSYIECLKHLKQHLGPRSQSEQALEQSGQWPRITAQALFQCLASNSPITLSDDWKACLVKFTLLALEVQRARRLIRLHLENFREEFRRELENEGCDGWNPRGHPDWLLIQLQGNFLIRSVQADVASEMIAPRSGNNTAMQLNMGEGKSSVIIPIVAVDLADGDQLVRVIVPKSLTVQMFYLLADRLGGLLNRRIYFLPFTRSLRDHQNGTTKHEKAIPENEKVVTEHEKVVTLHEIMSECMRERGILVIQPEHILSLRLVSVEKQLPQEKDARLARLLLNLQRWLHSHSRDILDESDDILDVRYQLVYTIGLQQPVEDSPERWTTTEQVLGLVNEHAPSLRKLFPLGVEYEPDRGPSGTFPHLRILDADAGQQLVSWIVQDIIDGLLPNYSLGQLRSSLREAVKSFLSCERVSPENAQMVQEYAQHTSLWNGLLLLRGLLACGVLLFVLSRRRWRVDYGLSLTRTMLAVPYRAKDVPAQRAEFGHPDIAIILTCLSYYYGGLTEEQLKLSFENLLKQDDPTLDYDLWVRNRSDVPECLQTLSGVNMESSEQWNTFLFPLFSRNRPTIDFYLSSVVFPKEAKEFPSKLLCSGWDLADKKRLPLTGFSGTNDGQYLLPLHITQRDPDHQQGTNAKVLSYLLQPENNHYMCMTKENGERRTTHEFLKILVSQRPKICVLLDVGAQMLDLKNHELAKAWLDINLDASAAIYFNEEDELTVLTRDGSKQHFLSSPFAQQLDQCVVYLDDAHTRGTDIKFPSGSRAAVTLGPKITKDRLAQGCMRMRKLGHDHSIMFFAPLEVDRCIRAVPGKDKDPLDVIETTDILNWAINETCIEIQQRAAQWAQQGMDHTIRYSSWTRFCRGQLSAEALSDEWLQPEAKKLEDLYGPHNASSPALSVTPEIRRHCAELGVLSLHHMTMDEEQEREIFHEAERERQVERPPKVPSASQNASVHPDVVAFVKTGIVPTKTNVFRPVFNTLDVTSAATNEAHVWSPSVLATTEFQEIVSSPGMLDKYLRPVQWVVSAKTDGNDVLVILSPCEVNQLIPHIRLSGHVHLHLYTPRITRSMKPCDDLALYSIPTVPAGWTPSLTLMDQLNVFSGQLYLKNYETYIRLCRFLCVYTRDLQNEEGIEVGCDGFISPSTRPLRLCTTTNTFQESPIGSLRKLVDLRRKGMRFSRTHMGQLLDGRLLSEDDFDDCNQDDGKDDESECSSD